MKIQQCHKCHKNFTITNDDLDFYVKMAVPEPTLCPDCRQQRRLAWRNERKLYQDKCDLCSKKMISLYAPESPYKVYCQDCWWSDKWEPLDYSQDYDFSQTFFAQYHKLQLQVPRLALFNLHSTNSEYTNHSFNNKNCYMGVAFGTCEDCMYGMWVTHCRNCVDTLYTYDSELCYECSYCLNCYATFFSQHCQQAKESFLCFECRDIEKCIACVQLHHKKYHILNQPVSQEEFEKTKFELLVNPVKFQTMKKNYTALMMKAPRRYSLQINCENCTGNDLYNCTNTKYSFNCRDSENSKYVYDLGCNKDCMDTYEHGWEVKSELCYEAHAGMAGYNFKFCNICADSRDLEYCDMCNQGCSDIFGGVCLKKQHYCILNKKYSESDYKKLKEKIIEQMIKNKEYGEYFPMNLSPFNYNESVAPEYFPLKKDEALALGCKWLEENQRDYQRQTCIVPNDIKKVENNILEEILVCRNCHKNYKIIPQELAFYRQTSIPIPKFCSDCRHLERMKLRNPRALWKAQCMCTQPDHNHQGRCKNEFETTYSPERKELVYCKDCYNREIY